MEGCNKMAFLPDNSFDKVLGECASEFHALHSWVLPYNSHDLYPWVFPYKVKGVNVSIFFMEKISFSAIRCSIEDLKPLVNTNCRIATYEQVTSEVDSRLGEI